jgi:hypothetical protein
MMTLTLSQTEILELHTVGEYGICVLMVINDGVEDIFVKEIYFQYDTNTMTLEEAKEIFLQKVKDYWNKYQRTIAEPKLNGIPAALSEVRKLAEVYMNE